MAVKLLRDPVHDGVDRVRPFEMIGLEVVAPTSHGPDLLRLTELLSGLAMLIALPAQLHQLFDLIGKQPQNLALLEGQRARDMIKNRQGAQRKAVSRAQRCPA